MAVRDLFLDGTIESGATATIQPASGTIYSFKRGNIHLALNMGGAYFTIVQRNQPWYAYYTISANLGSATMWPVSAFRTIVFSEAGVTGVQWSPTAALITYTTPFTAISNGNYVNIASVSATSYYTLVGVSIT